MTYRTNKLGTSGIIIILISLGIIAAYASITLALMTMLVTALIAPPVAAIVAILFSGNKSDS